MMILSQRRRRRRRIQAVVGLLLVAALLVVNGPPVFGFGRSTYLNWKINTASYKPQYGHWDNLDIPANQQINSVHAVMLNTGKVLIMAGSGNNKGNFRAGRFELEVFNPANNTFTKVKTPYDMFCSGHLILPDGNVLTAGGRRATRCSGARSSPPPGVMTVTSRSTTRRLVLPVGTTFEPPISSPGRPIRSRSRSRAWSGSGHTGKSCIRATRLTGGAQHPPLTRRR
jgi:hypothetical protein